MMRRCLLRRKRGYYSQHVPHDTEVNRQMGKLLKWVPLSSLWKN